MKKNSIGESPTNMLIKAPLLLSIVVPTMNNVDEFIETLKSIALYASSNTEVIVVDGGEAPKTKEVIDSYLDSKVTFINYLRDNKKGVFPAQNLGIKASRGNWVMVLNSGDLLTDEARNILTQNKLDTLDKYDMLIFSQFSFIENNKNISKFVPDNHGLWPHQSILVKKNVYEKIGVYREDFSYAAEQHFFAKARKCCECKFIDLPLTSYKLGGLSSNFNFKICKELYTVRKELGMSFFKAAVYSYVFPFFRKMLSFVLSEDNIIKLKHVIFKHYSFTNL